ncbi:MAG: hypothetical protein EPO21_14625 [Chloroflexota bacterium]|nr:MAG: hypothetical protein EPO21_14625 [Chloroflexota bacterium]
MEKEREHPVVGSPSEARAQGSTWETYRCPRCGRMFELTGSQSDTCPTCGYQCTPGTCQTLESSREEF